MSLLYTKNGRPLQRSGDSLYSKSGVYLGRISGDKVYSANGRYAGTIDGDRVCYRTTDSATLGTISTSANMAGTAAANMAGSALWGDEPPFPD
jgi:hypothetical protein